MTRLLVLGLLKQRDMSGYDIQQTLEQSRSDIWAGTLPGSIYHALKTMEKDGLVEVSSLESTGHRVKATYRITEPGLQEYRRLIQSAISNPEIPLPTELYTGLTFAQDIEPAEMISSLEQQLSLIESKLKEIESGHKQKMAAAKLPPLAKLIMDHMKQQFQDRKDFLLQVKAIMEDHKTAT